MAIVPQDISLFHRTVMDNIRYARPGCARGGGAGRSRHGALPDFIEALPDGFNTMVGDRGVKLPAASASAWRSLGRC